MPVSERSVAGRTLRTPQARVLAVLRPNEPIPTHWIDWPSMTSRMIARHLGTSEVSDYTRRALRGLRDGSPSGTPHLGLLGLGLVVEYTLDIEGVTEIHYHITQAGIDTIAEYLRSHKLPPIRNPASCTNRRYSQVTPTPVG